MQSRPNLKKFRKGIPEYIGLLHEMFHEVAVDGTSAYVPGTADDTEANDDDDDEDGSPMSTSTRKRGASSFDFRSTTSRPLKKIKVQTFYLMFKKNIHVYKDVIYVCVKFHGEIP